MTGDSLFLMFKKGAQIATKSKRLTGSQFTDPLPASLVHNPAPANRLYIFAKNGTNDHGPFAKGDKARGAYSPELVASYLAAGILVPAPGLEPASG